MFFVPSLCVLKAKARPTIGGPATRQDFIPYVKRKVIALRVGDFLCEGGMDSIVIRFDSPAIRFIPWPWLHSRFSFILAP